MRNKEHAETPWKHEIFVPRQLRRWQTRFHEDHCVMLTIITPRSVHPLELPESQDHSVRYQRHTFVGPHPPGKSSPVCGIVSKAPSKKAFFDGLSHIIIYCDRVRYILEPNYIPFPLFDLLFISLLSV